MPSPSRPTPSLPRSRGGAAPRRSAASDPEGRGAAEGAFPRGSGGTRGLRDSAIVMAFVLLASPARAQLAPPPRVVGYFASWSIRRPEPYRVADIPAGRLTHVNYAFALIDKDGRVVARRPVGGPGVASRASGP